MKAGNSTKYGYSQLVNDWQYFGDNLRIGHQAFGDFILQTQVNGAWINVPVGNAFATNRMFNIVDSSDYSGALPVYKISVNGGIIQFNRRFEDVGNLTNSSVPSTFYGSGAVDGYVVLNVQLSGTNILTTYSVLTKSDAIQQLDLSYGRCILGIIREVDLIEPEQKRLEIIQLQYGVPVILAWGSC